MLDEIIDYVKFLQLQVKVNLSVSLRKIKNKRNNFVVYIIMEASLLLSLTLQYVIEYGPLQLKFLMLPLPTFVIIYLSGDYYL